MILRTTIEPTEGGAGRELEVVAGSFEQGIAEIDAQTPPGWRRRHVIVDRP